MKSQMEKSIYPAINKQIIDTILRYEEAIVIGHKNPDGDCIFSALAVREILLSLGKKVTLLSQGPFKNSDIKAYQHLFESSASTELIDRKPLVIVVDCSTKDRPGDIFTPLNELEKIVFDHHSAGESFTRPELEYIIPSSVSTTLIINKLRKSLGLPLTERLAKYLYSGFATDTGFFHFINEKVGGETLREVSEFVDAGVSPYIVYDELHDGKELLYYKTVAKLIDRTTSLCEGQLLYSFMKKEEEIEGSPSDSLYAQLLTVKNIKLVIFFKEKEGRVEIGLRSKNLSGINAGAFASTFSGGGHMYAAGIALDGTLDEVMNKVLTEAKKLF